MRADLCLCCFAHGINRFSYDVAYILVMIQSFSDRPVWTNSADSDKPATEVLKEQSDQGLHCLPFCLHALNAFFYGRAYYSNFRIITAIF